MWQSKRQREIEKELRFHIENQVEENMRAGMPPDEARRQAILLFGGPTQITKSAGNSALWPGWERFGLICDTPCARFGLARCLPWL